MATKRNGGVTSRKAPRWHRDAATRENSMRSRSTALPATTAPGDADHYRQREKELLALQETALDLNRSRDSGEVLRAIVRRARSLVGSSICYLSAYDPDRRDFYMRVVEGAVSKGFSDIRVPENLGSCHPIVESKAPFVTTNYREDPRFVHAPSVDTTLETEGIVSMAAVPLMLEERVLGILYVADRHSRIYAPEEIALLVALGTHAALAIENARLFEETRAALHALEIKTAETQEAIAVHEQMIALVARGGGIEDLAQTLAMVLQAGVLILDGNYKIACRAVSPASKDISRRFISGRNRVQLLRALGESRSAGRSVPVALEDTFTSVVMTIVTATQSLGALVVSRQQPLSDHESRTLERGAIVCGIVLLSLDSAARGLERDISELFIGLRKRTPEASLAMAREMKQCGMDAQQPLTMLLIDIADKEPSHILQIIRGSSRTRRFIAGELEGRLVLLCHPDEAPDCASTARKAVAERTGMQINMLQSAPFAPSTHLNIAFRNASRCLDLMRSLGRTGATCTEDELMVYAVIFAERSRDDLDNYITSMIGALLTYDHKRRRNLVATLSCYMDSGCNAGLAATRLRIHQNTLRQRIDTIGRLLGNWQSFEVQTALKLHTLRQGVANR